jgi:hypothetical protein
MSVTVRYRGNVVGEQMAARVREAVLRGAVLLHNRARVLVSRPARRTTVRTKGRSRTVYTPSQPGKPPALRTGFGRSSITWWQVDADQPTARVGIRANGLYMVFQELGTKKMPKRPWLSVALADTAPAIRVLLEAAARVS